MFRSRASLGALLFLAAAGSSAAASPIIGGTATTVGQFPTTVAIFIGNAQSGQGSICTGTLIAEDWVVTAAHCMDPSVLGEANQAAVTADTMVFFNTININTSGGTAIGAKETFFDPDFDINNLGSHDSGLVHLAQNAPSGITPMPVNFLHDKAPIGITVQQIGFGATTVDANGNVGNAGKEFFLNGQVSTSCGPLFGGDDTQLLCFSQTNGKGKCEGDSGGPSLAMIGGETMLVGITSFGDQTCSQYGADTRPDAEKSFLLQHVPNIECKTANQCEGATSTCFTGICMAPVDSPRGIGYACKANGDCDSRACASGPGSQELCVANCTPNDNSTCPDNFDCLTTGPTTGACWPSQGGGGCDAGAGAPGGATIVGLGLMGLVLRRRRR